ncbi:MAG: HAMP domain-containing protein [Actinobacteria bacterium]|nr:HAMP domain-containing protein [Actinomycetota bacterium]
MFKTLRSRVIATYLVVIIICLLLASVVFVLFLTRYEKDRARDDLRRQVGVVARDIGRVVGELGLRARSGTSGTESSQPRRIVQGVLNTESRVLGTKLFLVDSSGTVVAEANRGIRVTGRPLDLPLSLLEKDSQQVVDEFLTRFGREYLFVSAPTLVDKTTPGFLMAIKPLNEIGTGVGSLIWYMALAGLIALGVSTLLALYLSGTISRPIGAVTQAARKMAAGDYDQEVPVKGSDETGELARDFNMMADRVRTAYELQQNFVGNVSHELRTPLTSIEGFSQALLDGVSREEDERRRSLEIINQESKRLVRVLNDLLLLSQMDAGELRPEKKPVDVVDLMRKMDSLYHARADEGGVSLLLDTPASAVTLNTDPDRLELVLTNLLDNAMEYTAPGGTITLSCTVGAEVVDISVADTGEGIRPELLPRIFERFYRGEKSRATKRGGAGLGLSICKELVKTLGGRIRVESLPGEGTTFTVTLPL